MHYRAPGDYQQVKVRLAEIDAPEKAQPFGERSRQAWPPCALASRPYCGRRPSTATDGPWRAWNAEARANAELVRTGMAWAYTRYQTDPTFPKLERQARATRAGLWVAQGIGAEPVAPWEWRKAKRAN